MTLVAHLWQSTLCAALAALLALLLRQAPARTRHALWTAASAKFLLPMSLLVWLGQQLRATIPDLASTPGAAARWLESALPVWTLMVTDDTSRVLTPPAATIALTLWAAGTIGLAGRRWREWRRFAASLQAGRPVTGDREIDALARAARRFGLARLPDLVTTPGAIGPVVAGWRKPRLVWPAALSARLTDLELDAVVAHEVCHVRRHDNLLIALHATVEAIFWFHPAVWWIGRRLTLERERACDEAVLDAGASRRDYAQALLKACRLAVQPAPAFTAQAGPADLMRRLEWITRHAARRRLSWPARGIVGAGVLVAAGLPFAVGAVQTTTSAAVAVPDVPAGTARPTRGASPAVVAAQRDRAVRLARGVHSPRLVHEVKPRYTQAAMQERIQGSVLMEALILEDGSVGDIAIVRSLDPVFGIDDAAVDALSQWQFEPGTREGLPVPVLVDVEMTFTLK